MRKRGINMSKILLPVDGSDHSRKAVNEAKKLFGDSSNEFILLNVQGYLADTESFGIHYTRIPDQDGLEKMANEILENMAGELKVLSASINKKILWGDPADQIVNLADEIKPDYIIMGSLGLTGLKKFLLGSVSSKVVNHANTTVIVVK